MLARTSGHARVRDRSPPGGAWHSPGRAYAMTLYARVRRSRDPSGWCPPNRGRRVARDAEPLTLAEQTADDYHGTRPLCLEGRARQALRPNEGASRRSSLASPLSSSGCEPRHRARSTGRRPQNSCSRRGRNPSAEAVVGATLHAAVLTVYLRPGGAMHFCMRSPTAGHLGKGVYREASSRNVS